MGKKAPTYNPPAPVQRVSGQELFSQGTDYAKSNMPLAFGARESALSDLSKGNDYYASFQPTSFENALSNQYFQNVWPQTEAYTSNVLSKSGMGYSPVAAATLGKQYGDLSTQIGQYLSDLGNTRATNSLNARLGIDPMASILSPYVTTSANQSNLNASAMDQYNQAVAQQQYLEAMNSYKSKQAMASMAGQLGGAAIGALLAAPTGGMSIPMGASIGSSIGGAASPMWGGGSSSSSGDLGQILAMMSNSGASNAGSIFGMPSSVNPSSKNMGMMGALGGGGLLGTYGIMN